MNTKNICKVPFSEIEIHCDGSVYFCCPSKSLTPIGNIFRNSFQDIWYSDKAKNFRREILFNNNYFCDLKICNPLDNIEQDKLELIKNPTISLSENPDFPLYVKFCHDSHCNLKCITCRDEIHTTNSYWSQKLDSMIENVFLPVLKNCEVVSLNGAGEVFVSKHCRNLIKAIVKTYPNMKFDLHTNGIYCDKKNCDELGITDKIVSVGVSMHAITQKTYDSIMLGSDYNKVLKNLEWLSFLQKKGQLKKLELYFVVQKMNYKEMADFVCFAKKLNADVYFWEYRNWGTKWGNENYKKVAIFEKDHPEYNAFAELLQNEIFESNNCHLNNLLKKIKSNFASKTF